MPTWIAPCVLWGTIFVVSLILFPSPPPNPSKNQGIPSQPQQSVDDSETPTIVVAINRLVGNNMPPLQAYNQFRRNAGTIIQVEAERVLIRAAVNSTMFKIEPKQHRDDPKRNKGCCQHNLIMSISYTADFIYQGGYRQTRFGSETYVYIREPSGWRIDKTLLNQTQLPPNSEILNTYFTNYKLTTFRCWTLNRIANQTEADLVSNLLHSKSQLVNSMVQSNLHLMSAAAGSPSTAEPTYLTNQNEARNFIIRDMALHGATWVSAMDGNVVLAEEGMLKLVLGLISAEATSSKYYFLPMFRLVPSSNSYVQRTSTFQQLWDKLSPAESQVIFRYDAPVIYKTGKRYGRRNKYDLMLHIAKNGGLGPLTHCLDGYHPFDQPWFKNWEEAPEVHFCGLSIRLPWWTVGTEKLRQSLIFKMGERARRRKEASDLLAAYTLEMTNGMKEFSDDTGVPLM